MEESKKKFSPWIIIVILGVIAILFSVFGFQQQSELQAARQMIVQLREEVMLARREADNYRALAEMSAAEARSAEVQVRELQGELERLQKDGARRNSKK